MTKPDESTTPRSSLDDALEYARDYYQNPEVIADFELLARYRPEVFSGYIALRQAAFNTDAGASLTRREKELVILAIEIGRTKVNPPPIGHAKRAIDAGATPADVAEVASLCIMIAGMLSYQESGRHALRAAEERYAQQTAGGGS